MIKAIPEGYHSITPVIVFKDARKAIDFYKKALGAKETYVMPGPNGKGIMHAEITIGNSAMMLGEEGPQCPSKSAESIGDSPVSFYVYVPDADAAFQQAVAAGAVSKMPMKDQFWGDRAGTVVDPFGHAWTIATRQRNLTQEEIAKAAEAEMAHAGSHE